MKAKKNEETPILDRLIPYMLSNYNYTSGKGLMHGKMGGVLFFSLYSKFSGNEIYVDYADMLMEDIYESLNRDMTVGFEVGLCGIGWCIEYMVRNGLIEGNTDEALEDIDRRVMEWDPVRIQDYSFDSGLEGILYYVIARMKSFERTTTPQPFDRNYLSRLHDTVNRPEYKDNIIPGLAEEFNRIMLGKVDFETKPSIPDFFFKNLPQDIKSISDYPLGILKGLTGVAIKEITK